MNDLDESLIYAGDEPVTAFAMSTVKLSVTFPINGNDNTFSCTTSTRSLKYVQRRMRESAFFGRALLSDESGEGRGWIDRDTWQLAAIEPVKEKP